MLKAEVFNLKNGLDEKINTKVENSMASYLEKNLDEKIESMLDKKIVKALKDYNEENQLLKDQLINHDTLLVKYHERLEQNERKQRLKVLLISGIELNHHNSLKFQVAQALNRVKNLNM